MGFVTNIDGAGAGEEKFTGGSLKSSPSSCDRGNVNLSTAAIASSKYAVLTEVCFVVVVEVNVVVVDGGTGGGSS